MRVCRVEPGLTTGPVALLGAESRMYICLRTTNQCMRAWSILHRGEVLAVEDDAHGQRVADNRVRQSQES